jgi:hypothetical protein
MNRGLTGFPGTGVQPSSPQNTSAIGSQNIKSRGLSGAGYMPKESWKKRSGTMKYHPRNENGRSPTGDGYLDLIARILHHGIAHRGGDANYYRMPCGRWWAFLCGLDPAYLWGEAIGNRDQLYTPLDECTVINKKGRRVSAHRAGTYDE